MSQKLITPTNTTKSTAVDVIIELIKHDEDPCKKTYQIIQQNPQLTECKEILYYLDENDIINLLCSASLKTYINSTTKTFNEYNIMVNLLSKVTDISKLLRIPDNILLEFGGTKVLNNLIVNQIINFDAIYNNISDLIENTRMMDSIILLLSYCYVVNDIKYSSNSLGNIQNKMNILIPDTPDNYFSNFKKIISNINILSDKNDPTVHNSARCQYILTKIYQHILCSQYDNNRILSNNFYNYLGNTNNVLVTKSQLLTYKLSYNAMLNIINTKTDYRQYVNRYKHVILTRLANNPKYCGCKYDDKVEFDSTLLHSNYTLAGSDNTPFTMNNIKKNILVTNYIEPINYMHQYNYHISPIFHNGKIVDVEYYRSRTSCLNSEFLSSFKFKSIPYQKYIIGSMGYEIMKHNMIVVNSPQPKCDDNKYRINTNINTQSDILQTIQINLDDIIKIPDRNNIIVNTFSALKTNNNNHLNSIIHNYSINADDNTSKCIMDMIDTSNGVTDKFFNCISVMNNYETGQSSYKTDDLESNKSQVVLVIKNLLATTENKSGPENKLIYVVLIFNILIKNLWFLSNHTKFMHTVLTKLITFYDDTGPLERVWKNNIVYFLVMYYHSCVVHNPEIIGLDMTEIHEFYNKYKFTPKTIIILDNITSLFDYIENIENTTLSNYGVIHMELYRGIYSLKDMVTKLEEYNKLIKDNMMAYDYRNIMFNCLSDNPKFDYYQSQEHINEINDNLSSLKQKISSSNNIIAPIKQIFTELLNDNKDDKDNKDVQNNSDDINDIDDIDDIDDDF
jgi:hypothetical protein